MRMIERVARAIAGSAYDHPDTEPDQRRAYRDQAKAAIAAMREPTKSMQLSGSLASANTQDEVIPSTADVIYRSMINAALSGN